MKIPCSQDCPNRSATCHADCPEYAKYAAWRAHIRNVRAKRNDEYGRPKRSRKNMILRLGIKQ